MAARLLYRSLSATLREQSRRLDFTSTWPASPGLRGHALAHDSVLELSDMESTLALVEWEDLLQRPELLNELRAFFSQRPKSLEDAIERNYPALAARLLRPGLDPIDSGFAALRHASDYSTLLQQLQRYSTGEPTRKHRGAHRLLFATGDVLEHRFFGRCVVTGWDTSCKMGEAWVRQNGIRQNLRFGTEQPFYSVLLERDAVPRYCSQENLALEHEPKTFTHPHAPWYFKLGREDAFVPSDALAFLYPDDGAVSCAAQRNYRSLDEACDPEENE